MVTTPAKIRRNIVHKTAGLALAGRQTQSRKRTRTSRRERTPTRDRQQKRTETSGTATSLENSPQKCGYHWI